MPGTKQQDNAIMDTVTDEFNSDREVQNVNPVVLGPQMRALRARLEDAGNESMNVNGSSTPVEFENGPSVTDEVWLVEGIRFLIADDAMLVAGFWNVGVLTNGIDVEVYTGAPALKYQIVDAANLKSTADMVSYLEDITMNVPPSSEHYCIGTMRFRKPIRLLESLTDIIRVTINDDLTGLSEMGATLIGSIETQRD